MHYTKWHQIVMECDMIHYLTCHLTPCHNTVHSKISGDQKFMCLIPFYQSTQREGSMLIICMVVSSSASGKEMGYGERRTISVSQNITLTVHTYGWRWAGHDSEGSLSKIWGMMQSYKNDKRYVKKEVLVPQNHQALGFELSFLCALEEIETQGRNVSIS